MSTVTIPCGVCPSAIGPGATTCAGCGRAVTEQERAAWPSPDEGDASAHQRGKKVREGAMWVGLLAILFAVSGPIMFAMTEMTSAQALAALAPFADDEDVRPIDGKVYKAGQLRRMVQREPSQVLLGSAVLAGLMAGLWLWARRAPLPAIACALALFLVVQVVSVVLDPSSIAKGILVKVFAVVALYKGFKAALAARVALQQRRSG